MKESILPSTADKSALHTSNKVNKKIRDKTIECINTFKDSSELALSYKIQNLNYEWDTERVLETNAALVTLLSSIIGYKKKKCSCFIITGAVGFFLLQHALQGWCPPLPIIRKLGVRTAEEIFKEKYILKKIRGDFAIDTNDPEVLINIAEK